MGRWLSSDVCFRHSLGCGSVPGWSVLWYPSPGEMEARVAFACERHATELVNAEPRPYRIVAGRF